MKKSVLFAFLCLYVISSSFGFFNSDFGKSYLYNFTTFGVNKTNYPVVINMTFQSGDVLNCTKEIKVTTYDTYTLLPSKVLSETYSGGYCTYAAVLTQVPFLTNSTISHIRVFFNNPNATILDNQSESVNVPKELDVFLNSTVETGIYTITGESSITDVDGDGVVELIVHHQGDPTDYDLGNVREYLSVYNYTNNSNVLERRGDITKFNYSDVGINYNFIWWIYGKGYGSSSLFYPKEHYIYDFDGDGNKEIFTSSTAQLITKSFFTYFVNNYQLVNASSLSVIDTKTIYYANNTNQYNASSNIQAVPCNYGLDSSTEMCVFEMYDQSLAKTNETKDVLRIFKINSTNIWEVKNITFGYSYGTTGGITTIDTNGDNIDDSLIVSYRDFTNNSLIKMYRISLLNGTIVKNTTIVSLNQSDQPPLLVDYDCDNDNIDDIIYPMKIDINRTMKLICLDKDFDYKGCVLFSNHTHSYDNYQRILKLHSFDFLHTGKKDLVMTSISWVYNSPITLEILKQLKNHTFIPIYNYTPVGSQDFLFYGEDYDNNTTPDFCIANNALNIFSSPFAYDHSLYSFSTYNNIKINNTNPNLDETIKLSSFWTVDKGNLSHYQISYKIYNDTYSTWMTNWTSLPITAFSQSNNSWINYTLTLNNYSWDGKTVYWKIWANTTEGFSGSTITTISMKVNSSVWNVHLLDKIRVWPYGTFYDNIIRCDSDSNALFYFIPTSRFPLSICYFYSNGTTIPWTRVNYVQNLNNNSESYVGTYKLLQCNEGIFKYNIECVNNWSASRMSPINNSFIIDLYAPNWTLISPSNGTTQEMPFNLVVNLTEWSPQSVLYSYDNYITNHTLQNYTGTHQYIIPINSTYFNETTYTFKFWATDYFNDVGTLSVTYTLTSPSGGGGGTAPPPPEEEETPEIEPSEIQNEADVIVIISNFTIYVFPKTMVVYAGQGDSFIAKSLGKRHSFLMKNVGDDDITICAEPTGDEADWVIIHTPEGEKTCHAIPAKSDSWFDAEVTVPLTAESKDYGIPIDFYLQGHKNKKTTVLLVLKVKPASGFFGFLYLIYKKLKFTLFFTTIQDKLSYQRSVGLFIPSKTDFDIPFFGLISWVIFTIISYIIAKNINPKWVKKQKTRNITSLICIGIGFILVLVLY